MSLIQYYLENGQEPKAQLATGKQVKAVVPQEAKPGWGNVEL